MKLRELLKLLGGYVSCRSCGRSRWGWQRCPCWIANAPLTSVVVSAIPIGSQGYACTCADKTEQFALYCFRHLDADGYGRHVVGYGCHRCGAHFFHNPDWTTEECHVETR